MSTELKFVSVCQLCDPRKNVNGTDGDTEQRKTQICKTAGRPGEGGQKGRNGIDVEMIISPADGYDKASRYNATSAHVENNVEQNMEDPITHNST